MKRTLTTLLMLLIAFNVPAGSKQGADDPYNKANPFRTDGALQPKDSDGTQGEDDGLASPPLLGWPTYWVAYTIYNWIWWFEFTSQRVYDSGRRLTGDSTNHYLNHQPFTRATKFKQGAKLLSNLSVGGRVDSDWKRYRNAAWNNFITAGDMKAERSFPGHKYVNYEIWGHRGGASLPGVSDSHVALVSIRYYYEPYPINISLPIIEFDIGDNFQKIDHVKIWVHTPNGNTHLTRLNISQPQLPTTPPGLPYPPEPGYCRPRDCPPPCATCDPQDGEIGA